MVLHEGDEAEYLTAHFASAPARLLYGERMMYVDILTYLPPDILCKVDRVSMAASLVVRALFLDNDLTRLAWRLPITTRIHHGVRKWPLRQMLKRYVPEFLFDRPKAGFGIPIGD